MDKFYNETLSKLETSITETGIDADCSDAFVDRKEEIEKVNLQALFDLSYDQFQDIIKDDVIAALLNGARPQDLDIAVLPKGFRMDPDKR